MKLYISPVFSANVHTESTDADHPVPIPEAKETDGRLPRRCFPQFAADIIPVGIEIDSSSSKTKPKSSKGRVEKRRASSSRKASIVFPKYKNGKRTKGKK